MATSTLARHKFIHHDETLPPIGQAAHIVLLTLKAAGCSTWAQLVETPEAQARVRLGREQQDLIDSYSYLLPLMKAKPVLTIAVCDACNRFLMTPNAGNAKMRCNLTSSCTGTLRKVSSTTKTATPVKA